MKARGTRKTFSWAVIEQPGEYFTIQGGNLLEECDGYTNVWIILEERGDGLLVAFSSAVAA